MRIWAVWVVGAAVVAGLVAGQGALESPELAWLLANESPPALSMRRITPKSVFLAPTFTSCSEGYRQDALGRCVKVVKLNQQAQWEYFLSKLNSMYAPPAKDKPPPAGPLRLPIPIIGEAETTSPPLPPSTTTDVPTVVTTTAPTTTPVSTTDDRPTETPLLIIVANTTEPSVASTLSDTTRTSTEMPSTMTTPPMSTTDFEDSATGTTPPPPTSWFYGSPSGDFSSSGGFSSSDVFTVTPATDAGTTTVPSTFRPSTYLPPEFRPVVRRPSGRPTLRPYRDQATAAVLRPQLHLDLTTPSSPPWPPDTTHRSTVRFPSERPPVVFPVLSSPSYVQYPPAAESPSIWWPTEWKQSLWAPPVRPSSKPWGHREPRLPWIHQ